MGVSWEEGGEGGRGEREGEREEGGRGKDEPRRETWRSELKNERGVSERIKGEDGKKRADLVPCILRKSEIEPRYRRCQSERERANVGGREGKVEAHRFDELALCPRKSGEEISSAFVKRYRYERGVLTFLYRISGCKADIHRDEREAILC